MASVDHLASMNADELRAFAASLIEKVARLDGDIARKEGDIARLNSESRLKQLRIDQLTHEMAVLKRWKFGARSEQLQGEQRTLFEETLDADLEAIGLELQALRNTEARAAPKEQPKRAALPENLPRREIRHEPDSTICTCGCAMKRIGEDVAEKLDYT
ncbi:MAG: IS66 family transposase, partial [Methylobacterium sp.]|nr:IS66 family transposase [Methylobacterium sp.]